MLVKPSTTRQVHAPEPRPPVTTPAASASGRSAAVAPLDDLVLRNGRVEFTRPEVGAAAPTFEQLLNRAQTFLEVIRAGRLITSVEVPPEPVAPISKQGILPATQARLREVMASPGDVPVDAVPLFELDDRGSTWVAQTLLEGRLERAMLGDPHTLGPHWAAVVRSATRAAELDPAIITLVVSSLRVIATVITCSWCGNSSSAKVSSTVAENDGSMPNAANCAS